MTSEELKAIQELNRHLKWLKARVKPFWVRGNVIEEATGWDNRRLTKARRDGSVVSRKEAGESFWYDLNSIHPVLLKGKGLQPPIVNTDLVSPRILDFMKDGFKEGE